MCSPVTALTEVLNFPDKVVLLVGSGVTAATDPANPCSTWTGLLKHGVKYCRSWCQNVDSRYWDTTNSLIEESIPSSLIQAAQRIRQALETEHEGRFSDWLNQSIGKLQVNNDRLIKAIGALGVRVMTTNYDNLISDVHPSSSHFTWRQSQRVIDFCRGPSKNIFHLHGHFSEPQTLVFDAQSYESICRSLDVQTALQTLLTAETLVLIGCGAGLDDPNVGGVIKWAREVHRSSSHTHFILVRDSDVKLASDRLKGYPFTPVAYGETYSDLAPFLEALSQENRDRAKSRDSNSLGQRLLEFRSEAAAIEHLRLTPELYLARHIDLAKGLLNAGGVLSAAQHLEIALNQVLSKLAPTDQVSSTLTVAAILLEVGRVEMAIGLCRKATSFLANIDQHNRERASGQIQSILSDCFQHQGDIQNLESLRNESILSGNTIEADLLEAVLSELKFLSGVSSPD